MRDTMHMQPASSLAHPQQAEQSRAGRQVLQKNGEGWRNRRSC